MPSKRSFPPWRGLLSLALGLALAVAALGGEPARGTVRTRAQRQAQAVHIAVLPARSVTWPGRTLALSVVIVAPQQPLQGVDAYLDFDPVYLQVVDAAGRPASAVEPGSGLPVVLQNRADNAAGQIAYSAGIALGSQAITGTLTVATIYFRCLRRVPEGGTAIAFSFDSEQHRVTEIAYRGLSVLGSHADGVVYGVRPIILPIVCKESPCP